MNWGKKVYFYKLQMNEIIFPEKQVVVGHCFPLV